MRYAMARNARTSMYEVHREGCQHTTQVRMIDPWNRLREFMSVREAGSAEAARSEFEADNEGCLATVMPCTARRGRTK